MDEFTHNENEELVEKFKRMINEGDSYFFDSEEIEIIIEELMQQFDFTIANEAIEYGIRTFPTDYYFRILKVKKLILEFELEDAEKELQIIEDSFPPSSEFYLEKVMLARMIGKEENALDLLQKALVLDPDDPEIHFSMAYELIKKKDINAAIEHVKLAMSEDEFFDEQLFTFSFLFEENQQYEDSLTFFSALTELFPLSKSTWFGLALAYSSLNDFEKSIEANEYVLSIDEDTPTAYYNIGNCYFELKDYEQARDYYLHANFLDEDDYMSLTGVGDCCSAQEKYEEAMDYYHRVLELNPNHLNAIMGILSILKTLGKLDEGYLFIEKAFSLNPQSFELLFSVLPFYGNEEQIIQLKSLFHSTLNQITNKEDFFHYFTLYCASNGLYDLGIEVLSEYIDDDELTSILPYYMAALYYLNNQIDEGNRHLKLSLLINYEGYKEFLTLDPLLESFSEIQELIELYKPV